jgi:hypothetical protein
MYFISLLYDNIYATLYLISLLFNKYIRDGFEEVVQGTNKVERRVQGTRKVEKHWFTSMRLHSATSQKDVIFTLTALRT